jgi:minor histocompatibility antigen H13
MKLLILHEAGYSMMGIGDIIVPGLLVSLCLRIDFVRSLLVKSLRTQGNSAEQLREDLLSDTDDVRYYFKGAMVGYFLGLFVTIFYLMVTKEP